MNANPNFDASSALSPIVITLAATSPVETERKHIGKRWADKGKWPVTMGVKSAKFFFERVPCGGLDDVAGKILARIAQGGSAIVAGAPKNALNLTQRVSRDGENFIDVRTRLLIADMDGVQPGFGQDLSTPEAFINGEIVTVIRGRLRNAGVHSLANAKMVVIATSSTGFPVNAKGEPANGEGRVRVMFETSEPLTLAQQKALMDAAASLPGFSSSCPDTSINTPEHFIFIERAILPKGMMDPIREPVLVSEGKAGCEIVDVGALMRELGLTSLDGGRELPPGPTPSSSRLMKAPPSRREGLLRDLVKALPNEAERKKFIGVAHAIYGASGGEPWARDIWLEWCARWTSTGDPEENERVWNTLSEDGENGIDYLLGWARNVGTPEALAAVKAIELAAFPVIDNEDKDKDKDKDKDGDGEESEDDDLLAQRMPTIDPKAFYGLLGPLTTAATMRSEATKVGVALQTISHVSTTLRPFYKRRGDGKVSFNTFNLQLGFSAFARKGTSAEPADNHFPPAMARLARTAEAQLAFANVNDLARQDAEDAIVEAQRKLDWTRSVCAFKATEIETEIDGLRDEGAETAGEIAVHKTGVRKTRSLRTMKSLKQAIAEAEAKNVELNERIGEAEARLAEVRGVLADQALAIVEAEKAHAAAEKALALLPPSSGGPEPWLEIFASLAKGPVVARGVSTGEGLVELIRDPGVKPGRYGPVEDPGVDNKTLFLNMEELGGVLAASTRHGATLSTMLRTAFDCKPLELVNKTSPTRCQEPYVVLSAGVTPAEFIGKLFDKNDTAYAAENGLGNRFFCAWVMRDRREPDTQPTPGLVGMMDEIAANIFKVYQTLKPASPYLSTIIDFSPEAQAAWAQWYLQNDTGAAASARAAMLIKRKTTHLWKFAGVLAVMNGEHEISLGAFEAALAWADYASATIDAIASTALERRKMRTLTDDGKRVLEAAKALGAEHGGVSARTVQRKTPFDKRRFDATVGSLLRMGPSPITLDEEEYEAGNGVKNKRAVIRLNTVQEVADQGTTEAAPF